MTLTANDPTIAELYEQYPIARTAGGIEFVNLMNDYIAYLSFANAGMLNKGNLLCFDYAMSHLPTADPIVEIGSFCGLSTNLLGYFKQKHGVSNSIFNCDRWDFEGGEDGSALVGDSGISHADYRIFVRDSYIRNVMMFSRSALPRTVELLSDDFFGAWGRRQSVIDVFGRPAQLGGAISFCYIDGNHSYAAARGDFLHADRFLVPGGFILFDDSADGSHWEVCRVIDEVKQLGRYRLVVKNPNYLFAKIA